MGWHEDPSFEAAMKDVFLLVSVMFWTIGSGAAVRGWQLRLILIALGVAALATMFFFVSRELEIRRKL